jgi:alkyl hydroperoxide reductase subunit AhpC
MPLKGGKEYLKRSFPTEQQPFNMILLPEEVEKIKKIDKKIYKVSIDFDESSKSWRKNKISLANGMFKYKIIRKKKTSKSNDV